MAEHQQTVRVGWSDSMQKNKAQSSSAAGGIIFLFSSGLHTGWSIWRTEYSGHWWTDISPWLFVFIFSSWYIAAIVGSLLGAFLLEQWQRKSIYFLCGILLISSSILFVVGFEMFELILCARLLAGIAHGIVYITTITHLAENVIQEIRGRVLATVNFMITAGIFITPAIYGTITKDKLDEADMYFGITGVITSVLGLIFTLLLTTESVTMLLRRNHDREALFTMMTLRDETVVTERIVNDMQELKSMIAEDVTEGLNIFGNGNLRPLLLITITKILAVLTNNMILNGLMIGMTQTASTADVTHMGTLALSRFVASMVALLALDSLPRKKVLSATGALMVMVLIAYLIMSVALHLDDGEKWLPLVSFIAFQVFVSLGIDPLQHVLTAEAFNSSSKAYWSIAFATTVENVIQIAAIILYLTVGTMSINLVLFATALLTLLLHCVLEFFVPETNGYSMRRTRVSFKNKVGFEY